MVAQGIVEAWNYWTDFSDPQEFMDSGRVRGRGTISAAVDAHVVEIPGMDPAWAGLDAEELEDIRDVPTSCLHLTQGIEWTWPLAN